MDNSKHQSKLEYNEKDTDIPTNKMSPGEIIIGTIHGIDHNGQALVNFPVNICDNPIPAVSTISITHQLTGKQVALLFADGNINNPVIMGVIHNPLNEMLENFALSPDTVKDNSTEHQQPHQNNSFTQDDIAIDGKRIVIEGKQEIVFKCGESSITLTKSGKILIRGKYLLNRSTGVNRIMGGSVQVN